MLDAKRTIPLAKEVENIEKWHDDVSCARGKNPVATIAGKPQWDTYITHECQIRDDVRKSGEYIDSSLIFARLWLTPYFLFMFIALSWIIQFFFRGIQNRTLRATKRIIIQIMPLFLIRFAQIEGGVWQKRNEWIYISLSVSMYLCVLFFPYENYQTFSQSWGFVGKPL